MKQYIDFLNNRVLLWSIGFFILALYFLPYFTQGQNVHVIRYDNLDSNVVWFKLLAESGKIFADSIDIIPNMMNGLPRLSYGSEFNVTLWLYYFLNDFSAYVTNDIMVHVVAFMGMVILLSKYIIKQDQTYSNLMIFSTALLFALVPFWSNGGLSVAGQPLVLYAFLNIRENRGNKWDWIILILMPLYSSFILAFFFFLFIVGLLFLYDTFKAKKINWEFFFALTLMISLYMLVEYRLVYNMFFNSEFISHRTEFNIAFRDFDTCFKLAHVLFLNGQDHTINLTYRYILPLILWVISLLIFQKSKFNTFYSILITLLFIGMFYLDLWDALLIHEYSLPLLLVFSLFLWLLAPQNKILPFLIMIQIIISYWTGFIQYEGTDLLKDILPFLHTFHMRFLMLQTLIWYIMLAISLKVLFKKIQYPILLLLPFMLFQTNLAFEYRNFMKKETQTITYQNYYAKDLYKQIENYIAKPKDTYRIVSIGIEPAIALYNGFYTVDGYSTNYPLAYKYEFRKIIKKYLDPFKEHEGDSHVIDDWGSKLYILTGQYIYGIYKETTLKDLPIDMEQLSYLGVQYIFSAYAIEDYKDMNLVFLKQFNSSDSIWPVYLYKISTKI